MLHHWKILLISVDDSVITLCNSALASEGDALTVVSDLKHAFLTLSNNGPFDAVLLDTRHHPSTDRFLLEALTSKTDISRLWLITELGIGLWRTEAERLGIGNILWRPLQRHDIMRVLDGLGRDSPSPCATPGKDSLVESGKEPCYLEELPGGRYFLAACPAMKKIYDTTRLLAAVDVPVLILGQSGVGKDIVANLLHKHSARYKASFISVNCAALPSDLLESELFGYEAGAFTGAVKSKPGKFELADHGSLLLDEIGEMSAPMQAKLLHVLQDGRYSRLGARVPTQVDVRVIAATNVDIEAAIAQSAFREDLYYRISAFTITIPPLSERREEIPYLVDQLLKRHAASFHQDPVYISPHVLSVMQEYYWPGNLRELSNYVIRMQVLGNAEAVATELTARIRGARPPQATCLSSGEEETHGVATMRSIVRSFKDKTESRLIQQALDDVGWNRRHAATALHISYRALLYKIQQYELKDESHSLKLQRT